MVSEVRDSSTLEYFEDRVSETSCNCHARIQGTSRSIVITINYRPSLYQQEICTMTAVFSSRYLSLSRLLNRLQRLMTLGYDHLRPGRICEQASRCTVSPHLQFLQMAAVCARAACFCLPSALRRAILSLPALRTCHNPRPQ